MRHASKTAKVAKQETVVHQRPRWMHNALQDLQRSISDGPRLVAKGKSVFNGEWRVCFGRLVRWNSSMILYSSREKEKRSGTPPIIYPVWLRFCRVCLVSSNDRKGSHSNPIPGKWFGTPFYIPSSHFFIASGRAGCPSNSKVPSFNAIQSSWTSLCERNRNVCPCLNRIAARNAKDSFCGWCVNRLARSNPSISFSTVSGPPLSFVRFHSSSHSDGSIGKRKVVVLNNAKRFWPFSEIRRMEIRDSIALRGAISPEVAKKQFRFRSVERPRACRNMGKP